MLLGNKNGNVTCWDLSVAKEDGGQRSSKQEIRLQFKNVSATWQHGMTVTAIQLDPEALLSFTFDKDGCCVVMDLKFNKVVNKFIPHAKTVSSAQLDTKLGLMLTGSLDYTAKLWRVWIPEV